MKKIGAGILAALLVLGTTPLLGASAAHAADDSTCEAKPAWTETIVVSPAVPAVPDTPAVPEIPEVSHMETVVVEEAWTETVVDKEAWDEEVFDHWQRYSWTGGPHTADDAPAFPSGDWQPNVQGDPHEVGQEGAYFRSHGNEGNGDWFYLEAVTKTVHHEAETHTVEHPAVTEEVKVIDQEYVPGTPAIPGHPAIPAVVKYIHHPAVVCPAQPDPEPEPTAEPQPDPEPAAEPAAEPAQAAVADTREEATALPKTGGQVEYPVLLAGAGMLAAGLLVVGARRRARR